MWNTVSGKAVGLSSLRVGCVDSCLLHPGILSLACIGRHCLSCWCRKNVWIGPKYQKNSITVATKTAYEFRQLRFTEVLILPRKQSSSTPTVQFGQCREDHEFQQQESRLGYQQVYQPWRNHRNCMYLYLLCTMRNLLWKFYLKYLL